MPAADGGGGERAGGVGRELGGAAAAAALLPSFLSPAPTEQPQPAVLGGRGAAASLDPSLSSSIPPSSADGTRQSGGSRHQPGLSSLGLKWWRWSPVGLVGCGFFF